MEVNKDKYDFESIAAEQK